jgi:2-acylglycerol O-acyltransferase 2
VLFGLIVKTRSYLMPATASVPLNAESANPEERKKPHFPPKSFADALVEDSPTNGTSNANGANGADKPNGTNGSSSEDRDGSAPHKVSVLRIVETGAPEAKEKAERPDFERQESQHEYSAAVRSLFLSPQELINPYRVLTILPELLQDINIENPGRRQAIAQRRKPTMARKI